MSEKPLSNPGKTLDDLRSIAKVATVSFRDDLYPELRAAGLVKTIKVGFGTDLIRYLVTEEGKSVLAKEGGA